MRDQVQENPSPNSDSGFADKSRVQAENGKETFGLLIRKFDGGVEGRVVVETERLSEPVNDSHE